MATNNFGRQIQTGQNRIQSFAFVIAAGACVLFSIALAASGLLGVGQSCQIVLDERINPNDAPSFEIAKICKKLRA
jgi:hypothetical protein